MGAVAEGVEGKNLIKDIPVGTQRNATTKTLQEKEPK